MSNRSSPVALAVSAALIAALPVMPAALQAAEPEGEDIAEFVVTGTRVADRSALDTAVPVDVISGDSLTNMGVTEIAQALSVSLPSMSLTAPPRKYRLPLTRVRSDTSCARTSASVIESVISGGGSRN